MLNNIAVELLCTKTVLAQTDAFKANPQEDLEGRTCIMQRAKLCDLKADGNLSDLSGELWP